MLNERFKRYLEQQFRLISPTREAMEYRQEVYQNLVDRAQEYRIKGMTDEDAIYDLCIDSLGDFKSTLKDFENHIENLKKAAPKIGAFALTGVAIVLFVVIGYLVVSFATRAWSVSWLILLGGAFLGVIAGAVFGIVKSAKAGKTLPIRVFSTLIIVLLSVFIFLLLGFFASFSWSYAWITFLVMVIAMVVTDATLAYAFNTKLRLLSLFVAVEVTAIMAYVILGVLGNFWHPYWIIIVFATLADIGIVAGSLIGHSKKAEKKAIAEKERINEDYYTMWKD